MKRTLAIVLLWLAASPASAAAAPAAPSVPVPAPEKNEPEADEDEVREVRVPTRSDGLTASGRTIRSDTLATTPKRSSEDLLRLVPGMLVVQHGSQGKGHQFYIRGFDAAHGSDIELTLDGIPLNEPSNIHAHGYLDMSFIIPEVVQAIDVRKGSFRLDQGNFATAASIDYRLGVPKGSRGTRIGYEFGSTGRHRGVVVHAPKNGPDATFVALDAMIDQGYGDNRRATRLGGLSRLRLWHGRGAHVDVLAGIYSARFGLPGTVRLDDINRGVIGYTDAYTQDTAGESDQALFGIATGLRRGKASFDATFYGKGRRLELDENFTGFLLDPQRGDRHRQRQHAGTVGAKLLYTHQLHDRVQLRVGGNVQGNGIEQRQDQLDEAGQTFDTTRELDIGQVTAGLAPGIRALPAKWLLLEGGVRLDVFHYAVRDHLQDGRSFRDTFFAASPRALMRFSLGPRWQLFAAYGRGFRSPEARSITLPAQAPADTDLAEFRGGEPRMTVTDGAEVGVRVRPGPLFDIGASGFGTWIGRESIFDHVSGFNIERSATQRLGLEADVQVHPAKWLHLGADFTYVHARFRESGAEIPGAPSILTSFNATLVHRTGWRAGVRWFLLGPRGLSYGARSGIATVLDASAGYRWRWLQVDLTLDNALGMKWREGEYNFASHWDRTRPRSDLPTVHTIAGYPFSARLGLTAWF